MLKTYECEDCGQFDVDLKINEPEVTVCKCGKKVKRVFMPPHYQWKCDGFAGRGFD